MEMGLPLLKAIGALAIILAGCELFTNGVEWFGSKLNLSAGAVGSVLAAVGTALPETLVPIVAIVVIGGEAAHDIGIGGILGAPFMLATLAFTVTGVAALAYASTREHGVEMKVCAETLGQDLAYFLMVYVLAVGASPALQALGAVTGGSEALDALARWVVAAVLVGAYAWYVWLHLRRDEETEEEHLGALYFQRRCKTRPRLRYISAQLFVSLVIIFVGAHIFVENLKHVAEGLSISPLVLSLIVTPIATELPEKFNSLLWVRKGKDTLAIGNISGAMVFQSCIPAAVGITMTQWALDTTALASAGAALLSGMVVYGYLRIAGHLNAKVLLIGLPLYIAFLVLALRGA